METDTNNSMIVRSVIELGQDLGLTAVAGGVENIEILNQLTGFTCNVAQGHHFAKQGTAPASVDSDP